MLLGDVFKSSRNSNSTTLILHRLAQREYLEYLQSLGCLALLLGFHLGESFMVEVAPNKVAPNKVASNKEDFCKSRYAAITLWLLRLLV